MLITVKNADFSSVKIGEFVNIPTPLQSIINAWDLSDEKKIRALVGLYGDLVEKGYWERIKYLYVPAVATSVELSHINLKTGITDFELDGNFKLVDEGLVCIDSPSVYTGSHITLEETELNNISVLSYINKERYNSRPANSPTYFLSLSKNTRRSLLPYASNDKFFYISCDDGITPSYHMFEDVRDGYNTYCATVENNTVKIAISNNDFVNLTLTKTQTYNEIWPYLNPIVDKKPNISNIMKISCIMDAINQAEFDEISDIFNKFNDALK